MQEYLLFKSQNLGLENTPEGNEIYRICFQERFEYEIREFGSPPRGPCGRSIAELVLLVRSKIWDIKIDSKQSLKTLQQERTIANPIGQKTRMIGVSEKETEDFWTEYLSQTTSSSFSLV